MSITGYIHNIQYTCTHRFTDTRGARQTGPGRPPQRHPSSHDQRIPDPGLNRANIDRCANGRQNTRDNQAFIRAATNIG
jgi:hypothetical protein